MTAVQNVFVMFIYLLMLRHTTSVPTLPTEQSPTESTIHLQTTNVPTSSQRDGANPMTVDQILPNLNQHNIANLGHIVKAPNNIPQWMPSVMIDQLQQNNMNTQESLSTLSTSSTNGQHHRITISGETVLHMVQSACTSLQTFVFNSTVAFNLMSAALGKITQPWKQTLKWYGHKPSCFSSMSNSLRAFIKACNMQSSCYMAPTTINTPPNSNQHVNPVHNVNNGHQISQWQPIGGITASFTPTYLPPPLNTFTTQNERKNKDTRHINYGYQQSLTVRPPQQYQNSVHVGQIPSPIHYNWAYLPKNHAVINNIKNALAISKAKGSGSMHASPETSDGGSSGSDD